MATSINGAWIKFIISLVFCVLLFGWVALCESVSGIYVFGDSLVDVGNNNHLSLSIIKANFPHNGVDFPTGEATGRFSNGKNVADFLAERVGLPMAPPYLSLASDGKKLVNTNTMVTGVSFASGGAGILNGTNELFRLYGMGARKFVVTGVGAIGCCPKQRIRNTNKGCEVEINYWSTRYNFNLKILLNEIKLESPDINYSYFDTYGTMSSLIQEPDTYGITEIKEACCGIGNLKADIPCIPISNYCSNRNHHLFWDIYHPTEMVYGVFAKLMYNGSRQFTLPINVEQLVDK